jgi:hypothetical protein
MAFVTLWVYSLYWIKHFLRFSSCSLNCSSLSSSFRLTASLPFSEDKDAFYWRSFDYGDVLRCFNLVAESLFKSSFEFEGF